MERVVEPPALLAVESGADDQLGGLEQVAELDQVGGDPEMAVIILDLLGPHLDPVLGALEPLGGADDADIVPHEAADLGPVLLDHHFLVGIGDPALVPGADRRRGGGRGPPLGHVAGGAPPQSPTWGRAPAPPPRRTRSIRAGCWRRAGWRRAAPIG